MRIIELLQTRGSVSKEISTSSIRIRGLELFHYSTKIQELDFKKFRQSKKIRDNPRNPRGFSLEVPKTMYPSLWLEALLLRIPVQQSFSDGFLRIRPKTLFSQAILVILLQASGRATCRSTRPTVTPEDLSLPLGFSWFF